MGLTSDEPTNKFLEENMFRNSTVYMYTPGALLCYDHCYLGVTIGSEEGRSVVIIIIKLGNYFYATSLILDDCSRFLADELLSVFELSIPSFQPDVRRVPRSQAARNRDR